MPTHHSWSGQSRATANGGVLGRRTPTQARCPRRLQRQLALACCHCNFIRKQAALRFERELRTPAMVAGIHAHVRSFLEIFGST